MYLVLYRKYRPKILKDVIGQEVVCNILKNCLQTNKIAHAYLFTGPRGIGKTSIAKIFAKSINCLKNDKQDACMNCEICKLIDNEQTTDIIEIDAASNNGVDEIRDLKEKVRFAPSVCKNKVYIIDEVHMLTNNAFNALLKTLEEPPKNVIFILCTTEAHKIPDTILSRVLRFDFNPISINDIYKRLEYIANLEKIEIEKDALYKISELANGGLRDALSLLDKVSAFSNNITLKDVNKVSGVVDEDILIDILYNISYKNYSKTYELLDNLYKAGKDIQLVISGLIKVLKEVLLNIKLSNKDIKINKLNMISEKEVFDYFNILKDLNTYIKFSNDKKTYLDLSIIKMLDVTLNKKEVKQLEKNILSNEKVDLDNNISSNKFVNIKTNVDNNFNNNLENKEYDLFPTLIEKIDKNIDNINNNDILNSNQVDIDLNIDILNNNLELEENDFNNINIEFNQNNEKILFVEFEEIEEIFNNFVSKQEREFYSKKYNNLKSNLSIDLQTLLNKSSLRIIQKDYKKILFTLKDKQQCINLYQSPSYKLILEELRYEINQELEKLLFIDEDTFLLLTKEFSQKYKNNPNQYINLEKIDLKIEVEKKQEIEKEKKFNENFSKLEQVFNQKEN